MCGLGILENSMTSMGHASRSPGTEATRSSPLTAGTMPCAGSSFMAMVPPVVSTITFLLSMSLFLEGEKGRDTWRREEGPFWRKGLPPSSKPPPSFPKDFWPVRGRHPGRGHGNQAYATRRLSAKIDPAPTCFYSIKTTGYLSSKNALGNRNTSENLSTLSRDTFLCQRTQRNNLIQQAHPHTGKFQHATLPSPTFISPTPPQPQTSQALIRAWRNGRS